MPAVWPRSRPAFGLEVPDGAHRSFEDAYAPAFRGAQRLFPDVPALLAAAERRGLPVALLTNSAHAPTRVKLEALDLVERFDVVVTTDTLGFGKPDPRVYLEACRLLGCRARAGWSASVTASSGTSSAPRRPDSVPCGSTGRAAGRAEPVVSVRGLDELAAVLDRRFGPPLADR